MTNYNCESCEELREVDPNLFVNGLGDDECTSLANDTGLVSSDDHNDDTDLNLMNDCLVGNMQKEIEAESVCNWKPFVKALTGNLWTMFKGIICALKGAWTNIHNIWTEIDYIENTIIPPMPKDILFADVSLVHTVKPGFPDGQVNRVNIPCTRTDGYIPMGIVGWNLSNYGSSTGVSNTYPFKVKLMGGYVSIQITNKNDHDCNLIVEATVIYVKF